MSPELPPQPPVLPISSLDDPRAITLLTTEHWSLLSARSLAYNEAFVRAGMFLTFLSMSFVALALVAQAMAFGQGFLTVAAIVAMVGGVLVSVLAMLLGFGGGVATWLGVTGGVIVLACLIAYGAVAVTREQARFTALFPTPTSDRP